MRHFCTVFDKNYLFQGVALYNSLLKHAGAFRLYALCMDECSFEVLTRIQLEGMIPVALQDVLTQEAESLRKITTHGQFCWICQPLICGYVLRNKKADLVTYLEADSMFFSSPEVLFRELGNNSVTLSPHNYHPRYDKTATAGKFCTQFNSFRNSSQGLQILEHWRKSCFTYRKDKPYEYPGQKSLDDWPQLFEGVKILSNPGAGVAPWNVTRFSISITKGAPCVDGVPVVFYHYHSYARYSNGDHELGHYPLPAKAVEIFYGEYVRAIREAERVVQAKVEKFTYRRYCIPRVVLSDLLCNCSFVIVRLYIVQLKRKLKGVYNVLPDSYFS